LTLLALRSKGFAGNTNHGSISFFHKLKIIRNTNLFFWILSGTLILMSFGAYESFMPVISAQAGGQMPSFGILVSLNAVVVILFQLIHLNHLKNVTLSKSVAIGFTLMALGFFLYTVGFKLYAMTFVATVVFSVGESFLFPCFEVYMDKIAPESQKALYFGAGEIKQIGFFLGPVLGGLLVEAGGRVLLFSVCGLWIILAAIALYRIKITALTPQKQL
jgi:MFS family permease